MSDFSPTCVTSGTTPPGNRTGIDVPLLSLKVPIPTEYPVESCSILIVNAVAPDGGFVTLKLVIASSTVRVNVWDIARSRVTKLAGIKSAYKKLKNVDVTIDGLVFNDLDTSKASYYGYYQYGGYYRKYKSYS